MRSIRMLGSWRIIKKCIGTKVPTKVVDETLRTSPILNGDSENLGPVEIIDIDMNEMFHEDAELAAIFQRDSMPDDSIVSQQMDAVKEVIRIVSEAATTPPKIDKKKDVGKE